MRYQTDASLEFEVDYRVECSATRARGDEPASGAEFTVTNCTLLFSGYEFTIDWDRLDQTMQEDIESAIADEIEAGE